ncbi:hypothetical protein B0J11DRAFT_208020 [Dendryphion nanum]|uniref:HD domain-containing protein n=1 Tax=Dendryphion nanum TaxID=256645 RepID=A0A9P9CZR4_9PLEO|nr:hypothetical protein B0J11DRAFT_208020 [Dendryphion nanum]
MVAIAPLATRLIAGIAVPNTALINDTIALARASLPDNGYNHVMRAWLNGQAIINHLPDHNRSVVNVEAFGVATILHDLGWAFNTTFVSTENAFEIDGAHAARDFLLKSGDTRWNKHRLQLVWDAIAIHAHADIAKHKEIEVALTSAGTLTEVTGPEIAKAQFGDLITVNRTEWEGILAAFPRPNFKAYLTETSVHLCRIKPHTTYGNSLGDFGERYLPGYNRTGNRIIDQLDLLFPDE